MTEKKNNYIYQGGLLAIAGLITRVIGLIYRIPLTRIIGTEAMGYYSNAYEIYNLALILSTYSVPLAVSKLVSQRDKEGRYRSSGRLFKAALLISAALGAVMSLAVFAYSRELCTLMGWPSAAVPLRFLTPTVFVFSLMGVIRGFFQGKKTMVPTSISQVIEQVFNAVGSIVAGALFINAYADTAAAAKYGAAGGTTGTLIGAVFGFIFLLVVYRINRPYFIRKELSDTTEDNETFGNLISAVILTMLPIILSQTIYQLSGFIDSALFGNLMEARGVGEAERSIMYEAYSNKYRWICNMPVAIASAFGVSIVPVLSAHTAENNVSAIKTKIAATIKLNMVIAIPAAAGLAVLGGPILRLLFGSDTGELAPELLALGSSSVVFFALSTFTNGVLQGIDHMKLPVIHSAVSLVVHVGIDYLLIGVLGLGAYGLVIGNVTYALVVCILNWFSIGDILGYRQEIRTTFLIPVAASAVMGLTSYFLYRLLATVIGSSAAVIIAVVWAVLIYFVLLVLFRGVSREEMLGFPKGRSLVRFAEKLGIFR